MSETAAIILAAGGSKRLGRPKPLLNWFGETFIEHIIFIAKKADLSPIIVVTGDKSELVENAIHDDDILVARNQGWEEGQSSSIKVGVEKFLGTQAQQFVLFLCDQPQISVELINQLTIKATDKDIDVVATSVNGTVTPPILFKRDCSGGLNTLTGDKGAKSILSQYRVKNINSNDEGILMDSDTEEDYQKLLNYYINSRSHTRN